jgi:hypothetical protein
MHADQLLEHHIAQVDQASCAGAVQLAQCRAEAVAKLTANANRLRVIEAQIERNEGCVARLERLDATVH